MYTSCADDDDDEADIIMDMIKLTVSLKYNLRLTGAQSIVILLCLGVGAVSKMGPLSVACNVD